MTETSVNPVRGLCGDASSPVTASGVSPFAFLLFPGHCVCPSEMQLRAAQNSSVPQRPLHPGSCLVLIRKKCACCMHRLFLSELATIQQSSFSRPMFLWLSVTAFSSQNTSQTSKQNIKEPGSNFNLNWQFLHVHSNGF